IEQQATEAQSLIFGPDVKLVDLAAIGNAKFSAPPIDRIADEIGAEIEGEHAASAANGVMPKARTAAGQHTLEIEAGKNAPIGLPPRCFLQLRNRFGICRGGGAHA